MLKNYWHIACSSAQLKDTPFATEILDEKIVLFRNREGIPQALKDRCCHRGMPLSNGTVAGDHIACGFHGWEFGGDGKCARIPSQPPEKPISKVYAVRTSAKSNCYLSMKHSL